MSSNSERDETDEVNSNILTSGASHSILKPMMLENEARNIFFGLIRRWVSKFIKAVSLVKNEAYSWWSTLTTVIPRDNINWEFFQTNI